MCQGADRAKKAKIQTLRTEFESLVMKDNEQIHEFYLKLNGLVTNIRGLGEPITESYVVKKILRAVQNESNVWYLDNGASSHITGFKSKFMELDEQEEMSRLWHKRLGHVNYHALSLMCKNKMVNGMPKIEMTKEAKNDVLGAFKEFRVLVERGPERKVRTFRTDRGGEFVSNDFEKYCKENGIERHYTAPYTTQQNGVVERRNRTTPTQSSQSHIRNLNTDGYDNSTEPRRTKRLDDIYNETEEIAIEKEMQSIEINNTWKMTKLPLGKKAIGLKWIYKLKRDAEGNIVKYKARLVAKGSIQEHGVDFDEIFAPVTRLETVHLLLALAAKYEWEVHHLEVKTTFLNGEIR
ncbi:uncharacterized protein LOC141679651 [Apium graveolens]|uniref:uncharacterized protein LOC141679651 n=1 Tax=Apium graveolens TaxID=4045 RepID=UPI003D7BEF27